MNAVTYRCINSDCGRGFPRQVKFCPFCGTRQAGAASSAAAAAAAARPSAPSAASATVPPTAAPARVPRPSSAGIQKTVQSSDALGAASAYANAAQADAQEAGPAGGAATAPPAMTPEQIAAAKARLDKVRGVQTGGAAGAGGAGGPGGTAAGAAAGRVPPAGGARPQAGPPLREPIGIGTWVLVAMILAVIWYLAKPANKEERIAARVEQAEKYSAECKLDEARAELASLRSDKAPAAQVRRVNEAINGAVLGCEKKHQRAKAWADLKPALENALEKSPPAGALDSADSRLSAFTKKWGADDDTRDLDKRIDGKKAERLLDEADACLQRSDRACLEARLLAAERYKRPELEDRIRALRESLSRLLETTVLEQKAPPAATASPAPPAIANQPPRAAAPPVISTVPQTAQVAQQARKILADAERELNQGNYKGAMDKADICATMIDVGNRECLGLKQRAERLNREMLRCVASGADWINDRCQ